LTFKLQENLRYSFTDVSADAWYARYVGLVSRYDLFPNVGSRIQAGKTLTRSEVAIAIYQYLSNRD